MLKISSNPLKPLYYVKIINNHLNFITVFLLYDLKKNVVYFGNDKIGEISIPILNSNIDLYKTIPISKFLFDNFLQLSLIKLNKTNKNIFLAFNGLEEWII